MKKLISLLMILAVLLSLCACGGQTSNEPSDSVENPTTEATEAPTEEKVQVKTEFTPEELYGHIDQTKPNDEGVYKIWNKDGVANMANVPDGTFELLCNIDMEGAALSPIGSVEAPFTGKIDGKNYIISNFTLASQGEALGFVGVNEGTIQDLQLEGVTATAVAANKYIGTMAGVNKATILRSKSSGTLTVDAAAADAAIGGAVGQNVGDFTNTTITVDVLVGTAEAATVGGIVGTANGGKVEFIESYGAITVTGENKTVGLFAGSSKNTPITKCVFIGADNSLNGELFTNLTNTEDMSIVTECRMRDNTPVVIPENEQKLRDKVVQKMNEYATIEWHLHESMPKSDGVYAKEYTYYGLPYNHRWSTLSRVQYIIDEEGYIKDWVYDLPLDLQDAYLASDCMSTLWMAYRTVCNSVDGCYCADMFPWQNKGTIAVGDWAWEENLGTADSQVYIQATGEQRMYEAYAQLKKGDFYLYMLKDLGGHVRMAAANAVVVRDQNGVIDPVYSYVVSSEQGAPFHENQELMRYSSCRANYKYTFANMLYDGSVPLTFEELQTGEMEPAVVELIDGQSGKMGMCTGTVTSNYHLEYVDLVVTDSTGAEVFNHRMFVNVARVGDYSDVLMKVMATEFNLGRFTAPLSRCQFEIGETYSYTISAYISPGDTFVLREDSFTYGSAE